jgi:tetratricopeptide (TPR) repeat protein
MDECDWAYDLQKDEPSRIMAPVVAEPLERADSNVALHLYSLKRIEAPGMQPYPIDEAVRRLLATLALNSAGEMIPASATPQPGETLIGLLEHGKALKRQKQYAEAAPIFRRATQLDPTSFDAWSYLAGSLDELQQYTEALTACDRAVSLNQSSEFAWCVRGSALNGLGRYNEALSAFDRAIELDPNFHPAWLRKAEALRALGRTAEADAAKKQFEILSQEWVDSIVGNPLSKGTAKLFRWARKTF